MLDERSIGSIQDWTLRLLALAIAYGLKDLYSTGTVEELRWILRPTAVAVGALTGTPFVEEAHAGYFSRELRFMIAPGCAGVNFLIVSMCMTVFGLVSTGRRLYHKAGLFVVGVAAAYGATVIANTCRILIAIRLHRRTVSLGRLTFDELHRLEGITVYFLALSILYFLSCIAFRGKNDVPLSSA